MQNGWIKLALLALSGLIISIVALGLVGSLGGSTMGMNNQNSATHQMAMDQSQQTPSNNSMGNLNQGMGYQGGIGNGYYYPNFAPAYNQQELWQMKLQIEELNRRLLQLQYMYSGNTGMNNNMFNNIPSYGIGR